MGCPSLANFDGESIAEQCSYYSIGAAVLIIRICVRLRTRGWRKFQADDFIAIWAVFCVVGAGFLTVSSLHLGGTWLFVGAPEAAEKLLKCQAERIRRGSIYNVVNW